MNIFSFYVRQGFTEDDAWNELEKIGCILYSSREDISGKCVIFGELAFTTLLASLTSIAWIERAFQQEVDWEEQWALHGMDYREGYVHVNLSDFTKGAYPERLRLKPGPGFGDLSHPTTQLVLRMMASHVRGCDVLDIGSGSGILTLAAAACGANFSYGIEIDCEAIQHAQENAEVNGMEERVWFGHAKDFPPLPGDRKLIVVMNMIWSEQRMALQSLSWLERHSCDWYISGILKEERDAYVSESKSKGWRLVEEVSEGEWVCMRFASKWIKRCS